LAAGRSSVRPKGYACGANGGFKGLKKGNNLRRSIPRAILHGRKSSLFLRVAVE